jgi:hypothetical protein
MRTKLDLQGLSIDDLFQRIYLRHQSGHRIRQEFRVASRVFEQ